ncbi:neurofilament heavy polypeptide-like [Rhipicephalus sanguineus]|uniref:neurofilament heavy polypeptide-like n=1 Tax=Rhipicephalus sanguineus TaxID=34632 RepID=UPI0018932C85|nr:neurofilament heavy polypeptide-like [Rhipicephalus sanguineus]
MSTEGKSSSKKQHDSQMDPQKKTVEADDSGLGTTKSRTTSSDVTSGDVHDPPKVGLSRAKSPAKKSAPGPSGAKSPAKMNAPGPSVTKSPAKKNAPGPSSPKSPAKKGAAPGTPGKSTLKKALGSLFKSSSPKPPALGASPSNITARTGDWVEEHQGMGCVETDPDTGSPLPVYHEPQYQYFDNRGEAIEVFPPNVLEQEGIRTKAPLASVEDLTSPGSERPDSPIPSTSFETEARIRDPPPPDRSPSPPVSRYPANQEAKKKGREKSQ